MNTFTVPELAGIKASCLGVLPIDVDFAPQFQWLGRKVRLLAFDEFIVVKPASIGPSRAEILSTAAYGVVGLSPPVHREAPSISGSTDVARQADLDELIWCRKAEAEVWEFRRTTVFGMRAPSSYVVKANWTSATGPIAFLFPMSEPGKVFPLSVPQLDCRKVVVANSRSAKEARIVYLRLLEAFYGMRSVPAQL
ncbi:hypothetical protein ACTJKQ_22635 [Acidovorax sp. 22279]|uniref:hypothetical protein n=1 Tax=Acidovorax sp. 22279 TaxID=3453900 RepID=UPI003F85A9B2